MGKKIKKEPQNTVEGHAETWISFPVLSLTCNTPSVPFPSLGSLTRSRVVSVCVERSQTLPWWPPAALGAVAGNTSKTRSVLSHHSAHALPAPATCPPGKGLSLRQRFLSFVRGGNRMSQRWERWRCCPNQSSPWPGKTQRRNPASLHLWGSESPRTPGPPLLLLVHIVYRTGCSNALCFERGNRRKCSLTLGY